MAAFSIAFTNNTIRISDECPICLEDCYESYSSKLRCGHKMCSDCMMKHAITTHKNNKSTVDCPLCRRVILVIPHIEDEQEAIELRNENIKRVLLILFVLGMLFVIPYLILSVLKDVVLLGAETAYTDD